MKDTQTPLTSWGRVGLVGVALALVVATIVLAFSWSGVASEPKNLPIGFVGDTALVNRVIDAAEEKTPDVIDPVRFDDRDDAEKAIARREVYGAVVLGPEPAVIQASAASPAVSQLLTNVAVMLERQLNAAAAAQAAELGVPAPVVTVDLTDLAPLADSDPRGVGIAAAGFPLVLGGMIGGIVISLSIRGGWRRLAALSVYAVAAGALTVGVLQGWLGILQGDAWANIAAYALAFTAIGAPILAFAAVFGKAGVAFGPIVFLLFANPISSATQPIEFLPEPWGAVGQWFPPGAASTLVRGLSYFPDADLSFPWFVLTGWAVAGLACAAIATAASSARPRAQRSDADELAQERELVAV